MTRTLRSRVVALAGIGVFVTGAALSMLSRQSLLALERVVREERIRTGAVAGAALARDLVADLETLEGVIAAPRLQPLAASARQLRLADGVCYADPSGAPATCAPPEIRHRLEHAELAAAIREAEASGRPVVSRFVRQPDGSLDAAAIVPDTAFTGPRGAAIALVAADGARVRERLPFHAALALTPARTGDAEAPVPGSPWTIRVSAPADENDPVTTFRRRSLWFAPSLAALAVLMAWGVVLSVQRPLLALTRDAERIAAGDFSAPIGGGDDEIGRLGTALEHMREHLKRSTEAAARANTDLERRVDERTTELQRLLGKLISAQEDERRRVARELHDETSQVLTALGLALHAGGAPAGPNAVRDLQALVDRLHDGVHRLIVNLRPPALDDLGLAAAIEGLADSQLRRSGIAVRCELGELQDARMDPALEIAIFRIVQESILNIVRHAGATTVLLQGGLTSDGLWIEVEDDGRGFDPSAIRRDDDTLRGIGLLGMRERAELLGGRLTIESAPAQGTRVRVDVPGRAREARAS